MAMICGNSTIFEMLINSLEKCVQYLEKILYNRLKESGQKYSSLIFEIEQILVHPALFFICLHFTPHFTPYIVSPITSYYRND